MAQTSDSQVEKAFTTNELGIGRLQGKNAIVTGAAGGIGLETCILFAREGANVLLADISAPALEKAYAKISELVPSARKVEKKNSRANQNKLCDVSKEVDVKAMVDHVDSWGGVDIIFNNAGIMHADDADAIDTPEKIWDLTQAINVKGVWFGCKHAVISFRKHKKSKGCVINTASVVALVGSATPQLAYTASKGAVLALTRELAIVHAREGFRFNALCPAPLNTPLLQDWLGDDQPKRLRREIHFPCGRFGEAIEQARAVLFLASDDANFINGQEFVVDGGMTKAYVTPEGPPTEAPINNSLLSEPIDNIKNTQT
ncbi:putative oxidoreductase YxbG [Golovinomyces cichoracearum]|uniref:Putative oxidoreductase YxbG n=1 Tax=Golovinomyces cichoracearum TaxID=62708 RepID=A0A420IU46_9PEZI|nr:putative oxidoreductase YxbG [Golovinomyces cichoracearum]